MKLNFLLVIQTLAIQILATILLPIPTFAEIQTVTHTVQQPLAEVSLLMTPEPRHSQGEERGP